MSIPRVSGKHVSSNVVFIVVPQDGEPHSYEAEKHKLASVSQVFKSIFEKLPATVKKHVITVTEFSPRAFKLMLRHVFERPYSLNDWKLVLEVYAVAQKYQIPSLQQVCEEFFTKNPVTSADAIEMFEMACKYGAQNVQSACEEIFEKDIDIILKPGFKCAGKDIVKKIVHCRTHLPPKQLLALINWGMYECRRRKITVSGDNVERCVLDVCGPLLSRRVSVVMTRLNSLKKSRNNNIPIEKTFQSGNAVKKPFHPGCVVKKPFETGHAIKKSFQPGNAVSIPLHSAVKGTLMASFKRDIICELKIFVLKGILEFTGIKLRLKPHSFRGSNPLDMFYSTENVDERGRGFSEVRINDVTEPCEDIMFSQGLTVKSGQRANITVGIEDIQMSRCLENLCVQQEVVDKENDLHFRIECSSNQAESVMAIGPFFIEKLYYNRL